MDAGTIFDDYLSGTVYRDKQVDETAVHLTLKSVFELSGAGQIDFGGGEYEPAATSEITPEKRSEDDDYGWWELEEGEYRVRFNEEVSSNDVTFLVASNARLIGCGASLANVCVRSGPIETVLSVPGGGIGIKENARIATISCPDK